MLSTGLVNHWRPLPEWQPGRRLWTFYMTFDGQSDLHAAVQRYHHELSGIDEFDLVNPRWLHVTLQGIAFSDQLDAAHVDTIEAEVSTALATRRLPALKLAPARLDGDALSMRLTPADGISALREDIRACVSGTIGAGNLYQLPEPAGGFNPHISIAYANASIPDTSDVCARLDRVPPPDFSLDVKHVSLVQLGRETHRWFWDHERKVSLATHEIAAQLA
jgi:hypothetical protein